MSSIGNELYSKGIISQSVRTSGNFDAISSEFTAGLSLKKDIASIEGHCSVFLYCLISVGGPVEQAGNTLAQDWIKHVKDKHNIALCLMNNRYMYCTCIIIVSL